MQREGGMEEERESARKEGHTHLFSSEPPSSEECDSSQLTLSFAFALLCVYRNVSHGADKRLPGNSLHIGLPPNFLIFQTYL